MEPTVRAADPVAAQVVAMTHRQSHALVVFAALAGGLILSINMGVRQSLGLYLEPMVVANSWSRADFAMGLAVQNLVWGVFTPFAGALADRFGSLKVLVVGAVLFSVGLVVMALAVTPLGYIGGVGALIGLGTGATGFPLVLAVVGRIVSDRRRSLALGMVAAGGSVGQFLLPPFIVWVMDGNDWAGSLYAIAAVSVAMIPAALILVRPDVDAPHTSINRPIDLSLGAALNEASRAPGFWLLNAGFFVCGFHVAFIATHFPAYLSFCGLQPSVGAWALSVIGLFNIGGTLLAGWLGGRFVKKGLLAGIYALRSVAIIVFINLPVTETSVLMFAAAFGMLWLSTVPLTSGLVAHLFGPRYVATLFGIVMMSHQVGAFFGSWIGGYLFDLMGDYGGSWNIAIALGIVAALIHLPIRERALAAA
ncbi:MFS transporter [Magnetovibrio sp.]|uniref:MFS transporter n=1 Tax=Magnetovibrio sp. TaxID=2024836 RepID=UPI002F9460B2